MGVGFVINPGLSKSVCKPSNWCKIKLLSLEVFSKYKGPGIRMNPEDHMKTASWGSSKQAKQYREKQQFFIESGMFREAQQMNIDDPHMNFGDKYNEAIEEMTQYTEQLLQELEIDYDIYNKIV